MKRVLIGAGKGGTGKTTATAMIGKALSEKFRVALLDLDVMGPNLPRLVGIDSTDLECDNDWFYPKKFSETLEVFSPAFLFPPGVAVAWSGEKRKELIHELIEKVKWDGPDIMLCDCPPGTSDEILAVLQYMPKIDGAIIITTGKRESADDASRLIALLSDHLYSVEILGAVENMGYIETPEGNVPLFRDDIDLEAELGIPLIERIPFNKNLVVDGYFVRVAETVVEKLKLGATGSDVK